jgi:aryl-alcohol dehydrogenase-like predicted oxidoreductase
MASVQNEYSLLCRQFDSDWAEFSVLEDMPLLAFSPLATGLLTGKYQGDKTPAGSRREKVPALGGRISPRVFGAVDAYLDIAVDAGIDPAQMAVAWCRTRPFTTIPIIGAVSLAQLSNVLAAADLTLPPDVLARIEAAHRAHPMPY